MNRKAKRNKYRNEIINKNVEINTLKNEIKELKEQIEKMKNCFNCAKGDWENRVKCIKSGCVKKSKWELER